MFKVRCLMILWVIACVLTAGLGPLARGAEPAKDAKAAEPKPKYVRIARDDADRLRSLQTAVVRFVPADGGRDGLQVDLVGAIHVGEKSYYEALNKKFDEYDVVLFELVAPEGTQVPKGGRPSAHPVAMMQGGMQSMLGLEHQLACVDYTKKNMVHADMSPEQFEKSMADRGESFMTLFFRMMGQAMAQQAMQTNNTKSRTSDFDLLAALFNPDRAGAMKRVMAEQFEGSEGMMSALEGPEGSTLITERNKVALKKLAEQIAAGKKKIAIFYGAGHLGDMEKRLASDFQLKRDGEQWIDAWNLEKTSRARVPAAPGRKKAAGIVPRGAARPWRLAALLSW